MMLSLTLFRAMRYYDYPSKEREDVFVELADLDKVKYGEVFKGRILLEVRPKFFTRYLVLYLYIIIIFIVPTHTFSFMILRVHFRIAQTKYEH